MTAPAVTCEPRRPGALKPGGGTRFTYCGRATATAQFIAGVAGQTIVLEQIVLMPVTGGSWIVNIGDTTTGTVVGAEGDANARHSLILDQFEFRGGGSSTAAENDLNLTADGAGECFYVLSGYYY